jgi:hypothetical protein
MASEVSQSLDRVVLLLHRSCCLDASAAAPSDLGLCQAQADDSSWKPPTEAEEAAAALKEQKRGKGDSTGKFQKKKGKGGKDSTKDPEGGGDYPWRRDRPDGVEGGSPPEQHPWRKEGRSSPTTASPDLGKGQGTPEELQKLSSPCFSDRDPGAESSCDGGSAVGPDKAFEMTMSQQADAVTAAPAAGGKDVEEAKAEADAKAMAEAKEALRGAADHAAAIHAAMEAETANAATAAVEASSNDGWKHSTGKGWLTSTKEEGGPPLPSDLTMAAAPPPPLHSLAGTWFDSLGNMIQVPLYPPVAWFTGISGMSQHELTQDNWGRLWCGNGVLHQVGYSGGPLAQDMPPSHLSWRTTAWKFSIWERVAAPPEPPAPPGETWSAKGRQGKKGSGGKSSSKGGKKGKEPRSKEGNRGDIGKGRGEAAPSKPELPKLGDFISFPALGESKKQKN